METLITPTEKFGTKPHKFFERYLNNNLSDLTLFLEKKYKEIEDAKILGVSKLNENGQEYWVESNSISTVKWREYNVFQFHHEAIFNLFINLKDAVKEACEYYDVDFYKENFMVQGWFNINHTKSGKLDWHDHGQPGAPNFHGYYGVNVEPSVTYYNIHGNTLPHNNKNNKMIVSEMGHQHAMADWDWDGPRITIAYDIIPLRYLINANAPEQHWIPLI
jgi:hypothetical protein